LIYLLLLTSYCYPLVFSKEDFWAAALIFSVAFLGLIADTLRFSIAFEPCFDVIEAKPADICELSASEALRPPPLIVLGGMT